MSAIFFAFAAALAAGFYGLFQKLAAPHVHQLFGAMLISVTAATIGFILLVPQLKGVELFNNTRGILFIMCAGCAAFCIDYFSLQAYSRGLPIYYGTPIFITGGIVFSLIASFFLGEIPSLVQVLGLVCMAAGAILVALF